METRIARFFVNDDKSLTDLKTGKPVATLRWTGTLVNGRRFTRTQAGTIEGLRYMQQINVYRGNLWAVDFEGKRTLVSSRYN